MQQESKIPLWENGWAGERIAMGLRLTWFKIRLFWLDPQARAETALAEMKHLLRALRDRLKRA